MIILYCVAGVLILLYCYSIFFGAPYVPTNTKFLKKIFNEVKLSKNDLVIDLGSGDGRMVLLAAQKGYRAVGYEINPYLWLISLYRLRRYPNAKVKFKSFWRADISSADLVFTFLLTKHMQKLEEKLSNEMKPGSYFASFVFELPNTQIIYKNKNTHFFKF